ncbi:MAG TPA: Nif3-like dinuclear metal center hexameric protein [Gemmatimonadaceae bacterium]|nr:Nif3-like dinuclear metal center hexameric protein [Gemmatimonadaceae bacterium]
MTTPEEIASYCDRLLDSAGCPDYPNALNGLQLSSGKPLKAVAAAVDFSTRTIEGAAKAGANLLIVHHGMFWGGVERLVGIPYRRLRALVEQEISVYSSHLPLDRHPTLGNNVLLAKQLGLEPSGTFARHGEIFIGVSGSADIETAALRERAQKFAASCGGAVRATTITPGRHTKRWAVCTGAGASAETLAEASHMGIDTLIVGEGPHWTAVSAEERGLAVIYAGHYATETLGVRALAQHLSEKFSLPWTFIEAPTGL